MANGVYAADGTIRTTVVSGLSWTGLYAADGSINIVLDDAAHNGVYHPCGAYRVNSSISTAQIYDPSGALYLGTLLGGTVQPTRTGFVYIRGADGAYLKGADGAYLLGVA